MDLNFVPFEYGGLQNSSFYSVSFVLGHEAYRVHEGIEKTWVTDHQALYL